MFKRTGKGTENSNKAGECSEGTTKDYLSAPRHRPKLPAELTGRKSGSFLREKGYTFFDRNREYYIGTPQNGVVEVSSWCGDDGPDEDGFGREEYYDWWLLDERLTPIYGIPMRRAYSRLDMCNNQERWNELKAKAADIIKNRS